MFGSTKHFLIFTLLLTKIIKTMITILGTNTAWIIEQMKPKFHKASKYTQGTPNKSRQLRISVNGKSH